MKQILCLWQHKAGARALPSSPQGLTGGWTSEQRCSYFLPSLVCHTRHCKHCRDALMSANSLTFRVKTSDFLKMHLELTSYIWRNAAGLHLKAGIPCLTEYSHCPCLLVVPLGSSPSNAHSIWIITAKSLCETKKRWLSMKSCPSPKATVVFFFSSSFHFTCSLYTVLPWLIGQHLNQRSSERYPLFLVSYSSFSCSSFTDIVYWLYSFSIFRFKARMFFLPEMVPRIEAGNCCPWITCEIPS